MESPAIAQAQTVSQRRFTVVQLPVFSIVAESLMMPFKYLPELVKFGQMPFVLILAIDLLCYGMLRQDVSSTVTTNMMNLAHAILFTPFCVAWTMLAIRGRAAVANHPAFTYSRTQWLYLTAAAAMFVAVLLCVGLPYVAYRYGQRNFESQITVLGGIGFFFGLGLFLIGYVRLAFIFPAIAIGRYAGIATAWRQTAGNIERLAAIFVLSYLPYYLVRLAFEWYMGYHPPGVVEAIRGTIDMLLVALATTALAGPALAYKMLVLTQPPAAATSNVIG